MSKSTDIVRVGVVGAGVMGAGIAEVCARANVDVIACERDREGMERGRCRLRDSLARAEERGKLGGRRAAELLDRVTFTTEPGALSDRQLVVEAVVESEPLKVEVFRTLEEVVRDGEAILASNTSSIPIMKLAMVTTRPQQVLGVHFFNPVPVMRLVELVTSLHTSPATERRAADFVTTTLDKHVVRSQDRAGFVVNALLIPYLLSAIRMLESGFASASDIDTAMVEGCAHPLGPLAVADLIGLDTTMSVAQSLFEEFKEPLYAPPPLLRRMVEAGLLGRKTGRGFHEYPREATADFR